MDKPERRSLGERFVGVALLDRDVFADVSTDRGAIVPAVFVVVLGGICNALGQGRPLVWSADPASLSAVWVAWIWWTLVVPIVGWVLWTLVVRATARTFRCSAGDRSLLRALGFANAPAAALLLRILPGIGSAVHPVVVLWLLAASAVAVEVVFATSRRRAVIIAVVGFAAYWLIGLGLQTWATG